MSECTRFSRWFGKNCTFVLSVLTANNTEFWNIGRVKLFHINLLKSKWNKFVRDLCVCVRCVRIRLVGRMFELIPKRIQNVQTNEKAEKFSVSTHYTVNRIFPLRTSHPPCIGRFIHVANVYSKESTCGFKIVRALEHESTSRQMKQKNKKRSKLAAVGGIDNKKRSQENPSTQTTASCWKRNTI